ncbi:MAG: sulfite exporter TauE/SafE family protein [Candidatus Omnitrophota bacterium]
MNFKIIASFFILGLSFGSGPCLASCGPLLICYSAAGLKNITENLKIYLFFSVARILVYVFFGLLVFFLGKMVFEGVLQFLARYVIILGGAFIVFMGVLIALGRKIQAGPWSFLQKHIRQRDTRNTFLLGVIIGFLPCAPLIFIISYGALASKTWVESLVYPLSFGLGTFFSPLLLLCIGAGVFPRWLKDQRLRQAVSLSCGIILVFMGIQLIRRSL